VSLVLDERRRAMLEEMGIRVFAPDAPPAGMDGTPPQPSGQAQGEADARPAAPVVQPRPVPAAEAPVPAGVVRARPGGVGAMDWEALAETVAACRACTLCEGRRNTVFGVGPRRADWMVIGEAPGEREDLQGEPFVGPSGKLLDNMLAALGLNRREHVYIANALKCRPPGNRNPQPAELAQCEPYLLRQVELVQPRIILAMGRFAVQALLRSDEPIGRLRGRVHAYNGVPLVVTYHPAYLLRNLPDKAKAWADLCLARGLVDQPSDLGR
jgi:uracil-DNA glycosylase family 4